MLADTIAEVGEDMTVDASFVGYPAMEKFPIIVLINPIEPVFFD